MPAFGLARSGSLCNELIFICFKKEKKEEKEEKKSLMQRHRVSKTCSIAQMGAPGPYLSPPGRARLGFAVTLLCNEFCSFV
jgi:hypothetical protein